MKNIVLVFVILGSLPTAAYAGPCGSKPCTTEQINRALQWLGRPEHEQIGHARVLHDGGAPPAGVTRTESRETINVRVR